MPPSSTSATSCRVVFVPMSTAATRVTRPMLAGPGYSLQVAAGPPPSPSTRPNLPDQPGDRAGRGLSPAPPADPDGLVAGDRQRAPRAPPRAGDALRVG